jgi:hypothetical protein
VVGRGRGDLQGEVRLRECGEGQDAGREEGGDGFGGVVVALEVALE